MSGTNISPLADESVATGALMPLVSLRKHFKVAITLFIVFSLLGVPLAFLKGKYFYSATATIYIAPHVPNILQMNFERDFSSSTQYGEFVSQQIATINRYDILLIVLKKLREKHIPWQLPNESERHAAERLQVALVIKRVADIYLVSVTLESDVAEGLETIVNTVAESYIESVRDDSAIYASKDRANLLYQQKDKLEGFISTRKKRLEEISRITSVTTFVEGVVNPYDALITDTQQSYSVAQRNRMEAEANLLLFENPKDPGATTALDAIVADILYKDAGLGSLKEHTNMRRSELIGAISGLDTKHPGYAQIKRQLQDVEKEVDEATEKLNKDVRHMLIEERRSKVTLTKKIEKDLFDQIVQQKKDAMEFSKYYNEAVTLNQEIKYYYAQLEPVDNRIGFFELESKAPSTIRMETPAMSPEYPIKGGKKKLLIIMVGLGFALGLVVPIVIDMLDKRIRTAGQVEKLLGYKPLAALLASDQSGVTPISMADRMRRLALALEREHKRSGKSSNLIVLTSVNPNSAVTSLVLDLVNDYYKIGVRAVAVEVNLLKPDKRYVSANTDYGFMNLLLEPGFDILKVVSPGDNKYPDRISIGLSSEELFFDYKRLQKVLEKIAEIYSVVILDAPAILFSADVEFLTSISDITLLVIAAQQDKPGEIKRAVKLLERIDPEAIGFVVTRLEVFKGGGYYSTVNKIDSKLKQAKTNFFGKYLKKMTINKQ